MRVIFAGSPGIAVPALRALGALSLAGKCELAGVLTNPDTAKGRSGVSEPTEVGAAALALGEDLRRQGREAPALLKPEKLGEEAREAAAALRPDLLISFAYGRIFGPKFLGLFPRGGINIHPSLLPRYRGPTPIPAAILHRDAETGITVQRLAAEMDKGDIIIRERIPLSLRETTASLSGLCGERGAALLASLIERFPEGDFSGEPQDEGAASYCALLTREDGYIDWKAGALDIDARIRAFDPWPLCMTRQGESELYILEGRPYAGAAGAGGQAEPGRVLGIDKQAGILIQTGDGVFAACRLQYRTRKALDWRSFLNGAKDFIGTLLR
jgi:methionyl-tRNA formyltransferase